MWIDLSNMWLNVVSHGDDGKLIHIRQLKRAEQVLEVLRQVDQPQIEARRNPITVMESPYKRPRTDFDMPHCW